MCVCVYRGFEIKSTNKRCIVSVYILLNAICFVVADEQERVQKKTFTNWMNSYLCQVSSHIGIEVTNSSNSLKIHNLNYIKQFGDIP